MKTIIIVSAAIAALSLSTPTNLSAKKVLSDNVVIQLQDKEVKYQEITVDEVPKAISETLSKTYSGYKTDGAFKGDDGSFKLNISKDESKLVLYFDDLGKLIKAEKPESDLKMQAPASEKPKP
ncbi:MAG: hypothetical protein WC384_02980 [Prolixibacteraceae bacterium]|jgi:hypothetical protein